MSEKTLNLLSRVNLRPVAAAALFGAGAAVSTVASAADPIADAVTAKLDGAGETVSSVGVGIAGVLVLVAIFGVVFLLLRKP